MASDQLPAGSQVRAVRIGMLVNGTQIGTAAGAPAVKEFTVKNDNFFSCDTWSAVIALSGMATGFGAPFWALQPSVSVQLLASLSGTALTPIVGGMVDDIEISEDMQTLTINGRDFTAPLLDNISNDKFVNQTSSDVATTLATRRGLIPQVTATTTPVGRYIGEQYGYMAQDISEFRILSFLAQQEGFDCYAIGKTLYFGPPQPDNSPLVVNYSYASASGPVRANQETIRLKQKKLLANKVTVQVRSWSYQNKAPTLATWQSQKTQTLTTDGPFLGPEVVTRSQAISGTDSEGPFYIVRRAGLTQQQADALAQKTLADITSNEREVSFSGPGILNINARRALRLNGTRTAFDQTYVIQGVSRTFSWERGCSMDITAKSSSPQEAIRL